MPEEESDETGSDTGRCQFDVRCLGKTHHIEEVTRREKFPLVAPACHYSNFIIAASDRKDVGMLGLSVDTQIACLI